MDCIYIELFMSYTVDHSSTGEELERVTSFKFLGVHIAEYLTWSLNTSCIIKRAQQRLFSGDTYQVSPETADSILTSCCTVWYCSCTAEDRKVFYHRKRTLA